LPSQPACRIASDASVVELDELSASGLWGITVPKEYGGAGVSYVTVAEVIKIISAAGSSLGQISQDLIGADFARLTHIYLLLLTVDDWLRIQILMSAPADGGPFLNIGFINVYSS
jgi:alkylation response protein AidB-like acyl-CoA dehydrogenase